MPKEMMAESEEGVPGAGLATERTQRVAVFVDVEVREAFETETTVLAKHIHLLACEKCRRLGKHTANTRREDTHSSTTRPWYDSSTQRVCWCATLNMGHYHFSSTGGVMLCLYRRCRCGLKDYTNRRSGVLVSANCRLSTLHV